MLLKWPAVAIGFALSIPAGALVLKHNAFPAAINLRLGTNNRLVLNPQPGTIRAFKLPVATYWTPAQAGTVKSFSPVFPEPGVYRTEPFACIVIVPTKHIDDTIAVRHPEAGSAMPIIKPELHFIPIDSK
jgi:hypothetical protein